MAKQSRRSLYALIVAFACMLTPLDASAGWVICTGGGNGNEVWCKFNSDVVAKANRGIWGSQDFVRLDVMTFPGCSVKCNFNVHWAGDSESFFNVPTGVYDHDIPDSATLMQLMCMCN